MHDLIISSNFAPRIAIIVISGVLLLIRVAERRAGILVIVVQHFTTMGIIKNTHLCVDVKTRTQNTIMHPGDNRKGMLSMINEDKFEFDEQLPQTCERNPKIWTGKRINVHKNRQGEYVVNFKRLVLDSRIDPSNLADEIFVDVERVLTELGL